MILQHSESLKEGDEQLKDAIQAVKLEEDKENPKATEQIQEDTVQANMSVSIQNSLDSKKKEDVFSRLYNLAKKQQRNHDLLAVISDGVKSIGDLIGYQSEYSQLLGEADAKNRLVIAGKNHRLVRGRTGEYFIPSTEDNTWL